MLNSVIQNNLSEIKNLCREYHVSSLFAFGSVCTDKFTETSDIDFLVNFENSKIPPRDFADNYFDLLDKLEKLLGKEIDLVSERTLSNPYFIKTVSKTKTPVYAG